MRKLYYIGNRIIGQAETVESMSQGSFIVDRSFFHKFDDGCHSIFDKAFSFLEKYGMTDVVFPTVGDKTKADTNQRLPFIS